MAHLDYENIFVSERGFFEVQRGRIVAQVALREIKTVRLVYSTAANRPIAEAIVGTCLTLIGLYGAASWILGRMVISDILTVLLVAGPIGLAMLYDALRRRFVLLVETDNIKHKLAFSARAYRPDVELFCNAVQDTYKLTIENKL